MKQKPSSSLDNFSVDLFKSLLDYNPITGNLIWKKRPRSSFPSLGDCKAWNTKYSCKPAGCLNGKGYCQLPVNGIKYLAHRIIYFMFHGIMPDFIDHIDGNRANNKIDNLRSVTHSENLKNSKLYSTNTSGFTGVYWCNTSKKWKSTIKVDGKAVHLGCFDSVRDAADARLDAGIKYGFHANHGGR